MKKEIIDRFEEFDDIVELWDIYTAPGVEPFRLVKRTLGAIEEDGTEGIGYAGAVEIVGRDSRDDSTIETIYNHFKDDYEEAELSSVTNYDSFINCRNSFEVLTYTNPDDVENIINGIVDLLEKVA